MDNMAQYALLIMNLLLLGVIIMNFIEVYKLSKDTARIKRETDRINRDTARIKRETRKLTDDG